MRIAPIAALLTTLALTAAPASAGEGMWVPQQLPEIAGPLRDAGLRLAPEQLADLTGDPMGAVVSLGGCTASFVSPGGLVATNHHCAYGAIQLNSTPENNLMQAGFYAPEQGAELSAGANARIFVLDTIRDVTLQVQNAIAAAPDAIGRARALEFIEKRLVADCEHEEGYRCRLYSFSGGNEYRLFRNVEIRDVRLVYAPPGGIGNFGGEVDNWMWPRHTGDFAFYRAYVGPDGKPADHAEENVPYEPRHWLRFSDRPLRDGDFVMAAGYPGRTNRYALVAEFEQTEQWTYPIISRHYKALIDLVEEQGRENPEIAVRYAATMGGWRNTSKNYDGQLEGFARIDAAARKSAEEAAVLEWLNAQGESGQQALDAYAELVEIAGEAAATRERDLILGQFHRLGTVGLAMRLYRNAIERTRPDPDREPGYQERDQPQIAGAVAQMDRRYHPDMGRILQRYWLQQYVALPEEQRVAAIDAWLGGLDEAAVEAALDRLADTGLANPAERMAWLSADRDAFEDSSDPAIAYAAAITPVVIEQEMAHKARAGRILQARPAYLQAVADFRRSQGGHVYPDANSSLRITFGNVTGYRGLDGTRHRPFTRLEEVADKATGEEPFNAPQPLLDAIEDDRDGGLADRKLRSVPVNFLSDLDVTGGNSGSPVLDADGRLVGLLFDMNWESVSSNWVFDAGMTRTISVDQRYMRWVMQEAFPAPELLEELDLPRMRR
ncbi:MAG: S46 family peptidase [Luteimonas sp.]